MLANMCGSSVNGASPTQGTPSPPIWLKVRVKSLVVTAMVWQPMPAMAKLPSGSTVDVLCGQPAQNIGARVISAGSARSGGGGSRLETTIPAPRSTRCSAGITSSGESSSTAGKQVLPRHILLALHARAPVGRKVVERVPDLRARRRSASPRPRTGRACRPRRRAAPPSRAARSWRPCRSPARDAAPGRGGAARAGGRGAPCRR